MIGRNDLCWCGSGKKWKKCHYPQIAPCDATSALTEEYYKKYRIIIKNEEQIAGIRNASQLAAQILKKTCEQALIGVTTNELNDFAYRLHAEAGAIPAPLNYGSPPYPKSICTSLNEVICHGIPDDTKLQNGDIINIDVTSILAGYYGDCSAMVTIGDVSPESQLVVDTDVPVLIPEINADHLAIIPFQQRLRGWKEGFIVTKPNCSLQSYMIPLYAIHRHFPLKKIIVTTLQALSGAGRQGLCSSMSDNVIPYIEGEEAKSELEPLKILGHIGEQGIEPYVMPIAAHCNRVPVVDGHLACVSVEFHNKPSEQEIRDLWHNFKGLPQEINLPSAPPQPIIMCSENDRPQPLYDRDRGGGMAVTVGRLRPCPV